MEAKKISRTILIGIGMVVALLAMAMVSKAQTQEGYLYGKVYTDRNTYEGLLRWGTEEVFWTDLLNVAKRNNDYAKLVPEQKNESDRWSAFDWDFSSIWENKVTSHQFTCQFGNLSAILKSDRGYYTLRLKNGGELQVSGQGYNDLGGVVHVLDSELGIIKVDWDRIRRVEFMSPPKNLEQVFGQPLYGKVQGMRRESYTGFIIWDNDERLSTDKLDGDNADGDVAIKFSDIAMIEKSGRGSDVRLKSGRTLFLDNSNDVNDGNRGVLVVVPEIGVIKFSWKAFRNVSFMASPSSGPSYDSFKAPSPIEGTVSLLDGGEISGRIIYDVDEALDFEIIEGKENDIEYQIPIKNIKRIIPKNFDYSTIELRSGTSLLLGGMRDVSEGNSGLLVFTKGKKDPDHILWKRINEITFK
jgi:hypothetical protein